jgi:RND family efflux transporter MFP subunit
MSILRRAVLPLLVILAGLLIAVGMFLLRPKAEKGRKERPTPQVALMSLDAGPTQPVIEASGVVEPDQQINLVPQVSGRVVRQAEALRPGGRFRAGEPLLWLEDRDYELAIEQQKAMVRQAELNLALERGRAETARQEWALLGDDRPAEQASLTLREPQLANAEAALASAIAGLERAELNLARTVLRAPFDAMVLSEQVDLGQVVAPGAPVASLVGTDSVRVNISLPLAEVALLQVPGLNADQGSPAAVIQRLEDGSTVSHAGRVSGLSAQLDPQARTARLLVLVDDPLTSGPEGLPLLPGAWVDVEVQGAPIPDIAAIPRDAVQEGDEVWVVTAEHTLARRPLDIAWRSRDEIFARGAFGPGEHLVPDPPPLVVEGLKVTVHDDGTCEICDEEAEAEAEAEAVEGDALPDLSEAGSTDSPDEVASP